MKDEDDFNKESHQKSDSKEYCEANEWIMNMLLGQVTYVDLDEAKKAAKKSKNKK